jgi:hypothetical protein
LKLKKKEKLKIETLQVLYQMNKRSGFFQRERGGS